MYNGDMVGIVINISISIRENHSANQRPLYAYAEHFPTDVAAT